MTRDLHPWLERTLAILAVVFFPITLAIIFWVFRDSGKGFTLRDIQP